MYHIDFYFDVISPYAHLAFHKLPEALQGLSVSVAYKPVLFAGFLKHHGQLGPAEIEPKKRWTFQQVKWLAHTHGVALQAPARHPFNPLPLLRLMLALGGPLPGSTNRFVAERVFAHVWQSGGADASDPARLRSLAAELLAAREIKPDEVAIDALLSHAEAKDFLKANTDEAIRLGLFGVPSMVIGPVNQSEVFWGMDALPILRARLMGDTWFETPAWQAAAPVAGVQRK